jgi:hypothetical protein
MSDDKPTIPYWQVWTDANGISRQSSALMTEFELKSIQPPAAPQWQSHPTRGEMSVLVMVLPVGWVGDWHENPKPQWIIPLSGVWFVETMDGTRVEMGAGEISFGGDQHCRTVDGKTGHLSGTVGNIPAVLMVVQYEDQPAPPLGEAA